MTKPASPTTLIDLRARLTRAVANELLNRRGVTRPGRPTATEDAGMSLYQPTLTPQEQVAYMLELMASPHREEWEEKQGPMWLRREPEPREPETRSEA